VSIGIDSKVAESTLKNKKVTLRLKEVIETAGIKEADKTVGNLLYGVATKFPESLVGRTKFLTDYIIDKKIVKP
jgi:glutaminyl-tRNA synthetase